MFRFSTVLLVATAAIPVQAGSLKQDSGQRYDPSKTRVAVLSVVNMGGERDAKFKAGQTKSTSDELHEEFARRGFVMVDDSAVTAAATTAKVDLEDEEQQTKANMLAVGAAVKADIVAFAVINQVGSKSGMNLFTMTCEGYGKVTVWVLDVSKQAALLDAAAHKSSARREAFFRGQAKYSDLIMQACAHAVRDDLKPILKDYPPVAGAHHP
jgi:TolB-like protein